MLSQNAWGDEYLDRVQPLLRGKCAACHGGLKQAGGLRLDTGNLARAGGDSGSAVTPGDPQGSLLWQRVTAADADTRMPPDADPLAPEELLILKRWIDAGAESPANEIPQEDPDAHWAFQPLARAAIPTAQDRDVSGGGSGESTFAAELPLDAFILDRLHRAGLELAPRADPQTLVRRLACDVSGITPSWEFVQGWTQKIQRDENAITQLIDVLLSGPRSGERAAQHWLDVVRYADTHGFEVNTPRPNAWPYRDYVIRAMNSDKPYNRFIAEQVAGDQFGEESATGFLVAAAVLLPGQIGQDDASKRLARQDALDEVVIGTSATFLGLTVGCARCHDHKFDPISQHDYYTLQAFFAGIEYGDRPLHDVAALQREDDLKRIAPQIDAIADRLNKYQPLAAVDRIILIDDEDKSRTTHLQTPQGQGENPAGAERGRRNDPGSATRSANASGGRYTWWTNTTDQDVFTWNPASDGRFRVWLSWGVHGSGVHTRDARYLVDRDGDLSTQTDQTEIAICDQYYPAGVDAGQTKAEPTWSGFFDAGIHDFTRNSKIVLRGGKTGTGITADALVLERGPASTGADVSPRAVPLMRSPVSALKNVERLAVRSTKFIRFTTFETIDNNQHEPCLDELQVFSGGELGQNLALGENVVASSSGNYPNSDRHKLEHICDGQFGNERSWISNERGGGWVQLEFPLPIELDTIVWSRDRQGILTDRLPVRYRIDVSIDGQQWEAVAGHFDRAPAGSPHDELQWLSRVSAVQGGDDRAVGNDLTQLQRLRQQRLELETPRMVFAAVSRQCDVTQLLNRGDPEQPLEQLEPALPTIAGELVVSSELTDPQRRRKLADWFSDPTSPLVARVIVNRVWQNHFGTGLVETPSDFGLNGARPSHPELLDYLSGELIEHDWSLKWLERTILHSRTYQQSSQILPQSMAVDADNRLLWRFPARRLSAEVIRDSVLAASGHLNLTMYGEGFDFFKVRGGLSGFPPIESFSGAGLRRMIYSHKIRMERVPVFGAFDCPDAGQPSPKRTASTTPIQALNLLNSEFVAAQSNAFAQSIERSLSPLGSNEPPAVRDEVQLAFCATVGRVPDAWELSQAEPLVREHGLEALCRVLFNSNEFLTLP